MIDRRGISLSPPPQSLMRFAVKFSLAVALVVGSVARAESPAELILEAPPESGDMVSLFNGDDLDGWDGDPRLWEVRDGVIHGETTAEKVAKGNTFLIYTKDQPSDFELRFSFRCNATNNSGVQYRSERLENASNQWVVKGYQHEIRNEVEMPNVPGFIYDERGTRKRICGAGEQAVWNEDGKKTLRDDLVTQEEFRELMKLDEFNDVVIIAKGNHIRHYLNGRLILDFTDNHPTKALSEGVLALQLHGGAPMFTEFKDIRMKEL